MKIGWISFFIGLFLISGVTVAHGNDTDFSTMMQWMMQNQGMMGSGWNSLTWLNQILLTVILVLLIVMLYKMIVKK